MTAKRYQSKRCLHFWSVGFATPSRPITPARSIERNYGVFQKHALESKTRSPQGLKPASFLGVDGVAEVCA